MARGSDYKIKKIEKGPLQRFKNQNLIIKKFGEAGLKVYKAITGKRTTKELRSDLELEQKNFDKIINYMAEAGMVELEPTGKEERPSKKGARKLEEIPPEEELEPEEEVPPLEEEPAEELEEVSFEAEEAPEEEIEEEPKEKKRKKRAEEEEELAFDEITPIEFEEPEEEPPPEEEEEPPPEGEEEPEEEPEEGFELEEGGEPEEESELSPVEKIISDKYGDVGLQVYSLIDGQRTAEEIMQETGLTEPKLVEILDFMDAQGIIKLDYPKASGEETSPFKGPSAMASEPVAPKKEEGFVPMIEGESAVDEARGVSSPIETPIKAPIDIVKSVQLKAKLMLKFPQNRGGKVLELINGKTDVLDIALKLDLPLFEVDEILRFMLENGMIILKPMSRTDVRKKYGDDGYSVYKRFGKEGLMLYELIGKELTIRQMADKITKDRMKIIDMFIFIHQVLGIELPIDRDVLAKQLGL